MPIETYGKPIKCGYARGERNMIMVPLAASVTFELLSGKFGVIDSSNDFGLLADNATEVFGWAEVGAFTSSSTAGRDKVAVDVSMASQYWIPADAAVTEAVRGETCDIITSGDTQQADVGESSQDIFLITEVDVDNQYVMVKIADGKQQARGVA